MSAIGVDGGEDSNSPDTFKVGLEIIQTELFLEAVELFFFFFGLWKCAQHCGPSPGEGLR